MNKKIHVLFAVILLIAINTGCFSAIGVQEKNENKSDLTIKTTTSAKLTETKIIIDEPDIAGSILEGMTAKEKAAQIILARFPPEAESIMAEYQFGGFTMYGRDFENETPETVTKLIRNVQSSAKIPAFIAVDEEGGSIVRVSKYKAFKDSPFKSPQELTQKGDKALVEDTKEKCLLLKSLGINFCLAPVADVASDKSDYIYNRTFGLDASETGKKISAVITVMNEYKTASCLKHFPGYGSNVDTHTGIAVDKRSVSDFEENDFIPFKYGIEAGVPAVLVNHNIINAYNDGMPATLAPEIHNVLRSKLGFEGVIITDDLGMDAIKLYTGEESVYVLAVLAGNDLLCVTDSIQCYNDIIAAVESGKISEERLNESVRRILEMKLQFGIIE